MLRQAVKSCFFLFFFCFVCVCIRGRVPPEDILYSGLLASLLTLSLFVFSRQCRERWVLDVHTETLRGQNRNYIIYLLSHR